MKTPEADNQNPKKIKIRKKSRLLVTQNKINCILKLHCTFSPSKVRMCSVYSFKVQYRF